MDARSRRSRVIGIVAGALSAVLITFVVPRYLLHLPFRVQGLIAAACIGIVLGVVLYSRRRAGGSAAPTRRRS